MPLQMKSLAHKTWSSVRFILFGGGGFGAMFYCTIAFIAAVFEQDQGVLPPVLSLLLLLTGAVMMLYGVGEWGRWAYLLVFFSIPASLFALVLIPGADSDKGLPIFVTAIVAFIVHRRVRAYYARKRQEFTAMEKTGSQASADGHGFSRHE